MPASGQIHGMKHVGIEKAALPWFQGEFFRPGPHAHMTRFQPEQLQFPVPVGNDALPVAAMGAGRNVVVG